MWDPFRDVDRFLNGLSNTIGNAGGPYALFNKGRWSVAANVVEEEAKYTVEVDVPGLKKEDVQVHVDDRENRVCISGSRARPAYHKLLQQGTDFGGRGQFFGGLDPSSPSGGGSFYESTSTVTTIDENGNVTSTTTTNNNNNADDAQKKQSSNKIPVGQTSAYPRPLLLEKDFGEFERCFTFPQRILKETTSAELSDGILTLTVDKASPGNKDGVHHVAVRGK